MTETPSVPGARLTIDLGALVANWRAIGDRVAGETSAVVKANAYGIGLEEAGAALARAGCRTFFVALPDEGVRLRQVAPGAHIYILGGLLPGSLETLIAHDLRPVLNALSEVADWSAAKADGVEVGSALHVDTGMNRLGITPAEAAHLDVGAFSLSLVMSHLVTSEVAGDPLNRKQLNAFRAVAAKMPDVLASLANSGGVYLGPDYHFDLVRPGIALYGASPGEGVPVPGNVVVTAEGRVLIVREANPGETVGYGATRRLTRPTRIAVLAAGYADGYHRRAGSTDEKAGAHVVIRGEKAPLLGRVSMDLIAVDVTDIPDAAPGDWAELFGPNISIDAVAETAGTVGYEFLTGLGQRYQRTYVGG